jgi:carboxyl-terminal processing protease
MKEYLLHLRPSSRGLLVSILLIGLTGLLGRGYYLPSLPGCVKDAFAEDLPDFALMREAWDTMRRVYVDRSAVNPHALTYGAIGGMVDALGDTGHSTFLSPEMIEAQKEFAQGRFEGIGAEVQMKGKNLIIVTPLDGSPAQRAGLRAGDVILKVDGQSILGVPLVQAVKRIMGHAGTKVALTVLSPSTGATRDVTIVRASVTVHNVTWHGLPGTAVALVRIARFSDGVTRDLRKILEGITRQGWQGVILDLRNDPGGILDEAVGVASQFLKNGNVLLEKDARGGVKPVRVKTGGLLPSLPMAVLVNLGSASAAEIVAGALQDTRRATLVGETTFGTGTVLEQFGLSDGSALLLAVQEWLTPDGHTIWHKGITPDVTTPLPPEATLLLPETVRGLTREKLMKSGDSQLLRALGVVDKAIHERR